MAVSGAHVLALLAPLVIGVALWYCGVLTPVVGHEAEDVAKPACRPASKPAPSAEAPALRPLPEVCPVAGAKLWRPGARDGSPKASVAQASMAQAKPAPASRETEPDGGAIVAHTGEPVAEPAGAAAAQAEEAGSPPTVNGTRYLVDRWALMGRDAGVDVGSTAGHPPLRAFAAMYWRGGVRVAIASAGREDDPHVVVLTDPEARDVLTVFGEARAVLGVLELVSSGAGLVCAGKKAMQLRRIDESGLELSAEAPDGSLLAMGAPVRKGDSGGCASLAVGPLWALDARPGVDAVLVLACMLALLLGPGGGFELPLEQGAIHKKKHVSAIKKVTAFGMPFQLALNVYALSKSTHRFMKDIECCSARCSRSRRCRPAR